MKSLAQQFRSTFSIAFFSFAGLAVGNSVSTALAQEKSEIASLKLAPIDVDIYSVSLRMQEQWERFVAGPVVKEFFEISAVENALERLRSEWSQRTGVGFNIRIFLENPNSKEALAFLKDLFSTEVFLLGDKNISKWYDAQGKLNADFRSLSLPSDGSAEEKASAIVTKAVEMTAGLTLPTLVIGARCKEEDLALGKLDQLEALLQFGIASSSEGALILKNLDRIDDARGNRLQLRLDGTQIPWDSIPTNDSFDEEAKDNVREVIEKKSITITIGMLDGCFILGLSPSGKALLELGTGKSILEHPEMQPVREALSRPLTSVSYSSDAMAKANFDANLNNFFSKNLSANLTPLVQLLGDDSEIRDFIKDLVSDCSWIDESIAKLVPEFKGATSLSYLTAEGWEKHDHTRTKDVVSDASSPLISLEHLGGDPMMFVASRLQDRPEYFQLSRQIVQKLKTRFDEVSELDWSQVIKEIEPVANSIWPGMDWNSAEWSDSMDTIKASTDTFWPYLVRMADTWEKKFLPAISGEHAIVLGGGNLAARQWFKEMPPSVDPLPLPEFAVVSGIRNKSLLINAYEDLFKICDDIVESIRKQDPSSIPANYKVPRPVKSESNVGEKYGYEIPADCPVPKDMMPQVLFAANYMIQSYSDKQSAALATAKNLSIGEGVVGPTVKQSSASYVDMGRIFEFARPWFRYALVEGMESIDDSLLDGSFPENYDLTGNDLLSAWGVLSKMGEFSSVTTPSTTGGSHIRSVYKSQKSQ